MNCKVWRKTKGQERREIIWLSTKECDRKWISSRYLESYWGSDHIKSCLPSKGVCSSSLKPWEKAQGISRRIWYQFVEGSSWKHQWLQYMKGSVEAGIVVWESTAIVPWSPPGVSSCGAWASRSPWSGLVTDGWLYCWWKQS